MIGKENRLARIFNQRSNKSLLVAVDHGMALGPMDGIVDVKKTLESLTEWTDSVMMTKGILEHSYKVDGKTGIVLRISGASTIAGMDLRNESITATAEEALYLGVDSVSVAASIGSEFELKTLENLSMTVSNCRKYGLPVMGIVSVGKDREKRFDPAFIKLSSRVLAEHGADIVKTYYTESKFEEIIKGCPVPVLIAGGPKCNTELEVLEMVYGAIQSGAAGIAMGRNLWQSKNPIGMIQAVNNIIHENATVAQVKELLG